MSIVISDPALLSVFAGANDATEVLDSAGNFLGTFEPPYGKLPPGVRSPFSDEEIEEARKEPDGRPLADILRDLEKLG